MAGYSKIYCIGGEGGFQGADGINPIGFQIWQGEGNRRWLEVHYFDDSTRPIGKIERIIPESLDEKQALLDACIAFYPDFFNACPSLAAVKKELTEFTSLDFDLSKDKIPQQWNDLRKEAGPVFQSLNIWKGELVRIS
jgi:hypothetical protein